MKLQLSGNIYDSHNKRVGDYSYSFASCRFHFQVNQAEHHFYTADELKEYIEEHHYHI